jgi:hypothetical protein
MQDRMDPSPKSRNPRRAERKDEKREERREETRGEKPTRAARARIRTCPSSRAIIEHGWVEVGL